MHFLESSIERGSSVPCSSLAGSVLTDSAKILSLGEIIGYAGRIGSAYDVTLNNYFLMQIVSLVIAPALFSAGLYLTIGNLF